MSVITELDPRVVERIEVGLCWDWVGYVRPDGYGTLTIADGVTKQAHRLVYESLVGPIPDGMVLDHLCRNTRCVCPDHLEPVTHTENVRRGARPRQRFCPAGNEYTPDNTSRWQGHKACKACDRDRHREAYRIKTGWYERHPA